MIDPTQANSFFLDITMPDNASPYKLVFRNIFEYFEQADMSPEDVHAVFMGSKPVAVVDTSVKPSEPYTRSDYSDVFFLLGRQSACNGGVILWVEWGDYQYFWAEKASSLAAKLCMSAFDCPVL